MNIKSKTESRDRRRKRIRAKIFGTALKPRLSVFKSNRYISAQLVNDDLGNTLLAGSTKSLKGKTSRDKAKLLGANLAKDALAKGISVAVFDRGGYVYTGSVAAVAEGAREGGLKF